MKPTKKQKILYFICFLFVCALVFTFSILCGNFYREETRQIEVNGINGECMVTDVKFSKRRYGGKEMTVRYEYEVNGEVYKRVETFSISGIFRDFNGTFVYLGGIYAGMKYEIKYLEDNPQKSRIYLDKLIGVEY